MKPVRLHAQEIKAVLKAITGNVSANSYRGGGGTIIEVYIPK